MRKDRILERLEALGISKFEAPLRVGRSRTFIDDYLTGRKSEFKGRGSSDVAAALECSLEYLTGESDEIGAPPSAVTPERVVKRLQFGGVIEEGAFRERGVSIARAPTGVPHLPGYSAGDQIIFEVRGDAYREKLAGDGSYVICLKAARAGQELRSGAWVVVRRAMGGMQATVLRELQYFPDRVELRCILSGKVSETVEASVFGQEVEVIGVAMWTSAACPR